MDRIKEHENYLKLLTTANKRLRKSIITSSNRDQIFAICEIILNLLKGNINISKTTYEKLQSYKNLLRKIVKRSSLKKKKYLIQKGGFFEVLIPTIVSTLATLVGDFLFQK